MHDSIITKNNSLTVQSSNPDWDGAKSQKFKKGKRIFTSKDLKLNQNCSPYQETFVSIQTIQTARQHFAEPYSPQYQFKRPKKQVKWGQHWYQRTSQRKTFDFKKPSNSLPRSEKRHNKQFHNPENHFESIKTSFRTKYAHTNEYTIEDRMQRKLRVEPLELKRTFYKNFDIFTRPQNF